MSAPFHVRNEGISLGRLFFHYYFRSVVEKLSAAKKARSKPATTDDSLFLVENDRWLSKYDDGKLRRKRMEIFANMKGAKTL